MLPTALILLDSLLYAISLTALYSTLQILTYNQFALAIPPISAVILESLFPILPLFFIANLPLRGKTNGRAFQLGFVVLGIFAGTNLITISTKESYLFVMKRAPLVGTIWVWSVIELSLGGAITVIVACLAWYRYCTVEV